MPSKDREPGTSPLAKYLRYSHVGLQFGLSVGLPTAAGIWADRYLGTGVLLTLIGLALGFGAGVFSLYHEVYRLTGSSRAPGSPEHGDKGRGGPGAAEGERSGNE